MKSRADGERRIPLYDRPLSQTDADRHVRVGAPLMGIGMSMFGAVGLLIARMVDTSSSSTTMVVATVALGLLGYAVTLYGGITSGHGRKQGGGPWLQPRVMRRLWAAGEHFWLVSACLNAIAGVVIAVVLVFGSAEPEFWGLLALTFFTGLTTAAMWRFARYRRQSAVSA